MAVIDPVGLFKGKRIRRCSGKARLLWPYLYLISNGYARIELDYQCIADEFVSFREFAPTPEELAQAFGEYRENHLIFVYAVNGQEWGQWDTRRSLLKEYKTAGDKTSPDPPEDEYCRWLIEQHGDEWPTFHWNKGENQDTLGRDLTKSLPNVSEDFALGVGVVLGVTLALVLEKEQRRLLTTRVSQGRSRYCPLQTLSTPSIALMISPPTHTPRIPKKLPRLPPSRPSRRPSR